MDAAAGAGDGFERVARLDEVSEGSLLGVTLSSGEQVCLANDGGVIHAVSNVCTHQDFLMSDGTLLPGCVIECAWHGARFDLVSGAVRAQPAVDPLPVYPVRVDGGEIFVGRRA